MHSQRTAIHTVMPRRECICDDMLPAVDCLSIRLWGTASVYLIMLLFFVSTRMDLARQPTLE